MAAIDPRSVRAHMPASGVADFSVWGHKHRFSGVSHLIGVTVVWEITHPLFLSRFFVT